MAAFLMSHDVQYQLIGLVHRFFAYLCEVPDAFIYIIIDNSFYGSHTLVLNGEDCGK
jgi:hypothetical protein